MTQQGEFARSSLTIGLLGLSLVGACGDERQVDVGAVDPSLEPPPAYWDGPAPVAQRAEVVPLDGEELSIARADYTGRVVLPGGASFSVEDLQVRGGLGEDATPTGDGTFTMRLNTEAVGLLTASDPSGRVVLMTVFPKHPGLRPRNPTLDAHETAAALAFMQYGVVTADPLLAAVTLHVIRALPATSRLAAALEAEIAAGASALTWSTKVAEGVAAINAELVTLGAAVSQTSGLEEDESRPGFTDRDGQDRDGVYARVETAGERGSLHVENRLGRWVLFYLDREGSTYSLFPSDDPASQWLGAVNPRRFQIPSVRDLIIELIGKNLLGIVSDLFNDRDIVDGLLSRLNELVEDYAGRTKATMELDLTAGFARSELGAYGWGLAGPYDGHDRWIASMMLTGLTEVIVPVVSLVIDLDLGSQFDARRPDFTSTVRLVAEIHRTYGAKIATLAVDAGTELFVGTEGARDLLDRFLGLAADLVQDPRVIELLARRNGPIRQILTERAADLLVGLLERISPYDTAINVANTVLSVGNAIVAVTMTDRADIYDLGRGTAPVDIVVRWTDPQADLDLYVEEPSAIVYYARPRSQGGGGRLDGSGGTSRQLEHYHLSSTAPLAVSGGALAARVHYFAHRDRASPPSVEYELEVTVAGREPETYRGVLTGPDRANEGSGAEGPDWSERVEVAFEGTRR